MILVGNVLGNILIEILLRRIRRRSLVVERTVLETESGYSCCRRIWLAVPGNGYPIVTWAG